MNMEAVEVTISIRVTTWKNGEKGHLVAGFQFCAPGHFRFVSGDLPIKVVGKSEEANTPLPSPGTAAPPSDPNPPHFNYPGS
ncbi:hypothetical protein GWI33_019087 [Rhynchophorus ferrugineus]|uniref:Uncharacterized protein n=1 Tax=Rhynchophorus ferrugineus TaxID=354439 RepID=A0A834HTJ4_RHYFE|nr:hypothetical protein GWI33_019087 [Rhynchophorus ferrugineus]